MADSPRMQTGEHVRRLAREIRDEQWAFAERARRVGTVWVCWWNKNRRHDTSKPLPDDLIVCGLIDGMELLDWLNRHPDWWQIGEWSDERYAAPVTITPEGCAALDRREDFDLEPVYGGLVAPGWMAIPMPRAEAGHG